MLMCLVYPSRRLLLVAHAINFAGLLDRMPAVWDYMCWCAIMEVTFVVSVDLDGTILGLSVPSRSGFKSFDAAAIKALNKVGKLPAPPERWNPRHDKVLIPFNAQSVQ